MDMAAQLMQHPSCCLNICLHLVKPLLQFVVLILSDTAAGAFRGAAGQDDSTCSSMVRAVVIAEWGVTSEHGGGC